MYSSLKLNMRYEHLKPRATNSSNNKYMNEWITGKDNKLLKCI